MRLEMSEGGWKYYPASTLPAPLDIVLCRFPHNIDLGQPGPTPRPGLVIQTAISETGLRGEVRVAYGTTNLKLHQRPLDLFVVNYQEMYEAGLHKATRFDLDKVLWLPWSEDFFEPPNHNHYHSPVIGHLPEKSCRILGHLLAERERRVQK